MEWANSFEQAKSANSNNILSYNASSYSVSVPASAHQEQFLLDPGGFLGFNAVSSATESDFERLGINSSTIIPDLILQNAGNSTKEINKTMVTTTVGFLPLGLGLICVCTLGLLGNILSAIVLARPRMKSTYSILTLGLTFCDSIYLLTKLLRYGILSMFVHLKIAYSYTEILYPIVGPHLRALTFTAHTGSTYFTVVLAVDRYISVCWPVEARFLCTKRRAHVLVIMVSLFSILYNLPRWIEFHTNVSTVYDDTLDSNITLYSMEISSLRKNPVYKIYYIFWAYFIIMFFLPFTSLTFFNFAIFHKVRQSNITREKLTSFQKREISFAMMLLSIVAVFLFCSFDYLVLDLLTYFKKPYSPFWDELGNFLLTVNSAVNFIIYCAFGRKFRQEFFQVMREVSRSRVSQKTSSSRIVTNSFSGNESKHDGNPKHTQSQKLCKCQHE